jgi:hypothetical protein
MKFYSIHKIKETIGVKSELQKQVLQKRLDFFTVGTLNLLKYV